MAGVDLGGFLVVSETVPVWRGFPSKPLAWLHVPESNRGRFRVKGRVRTRITQLSGFPQHPDWYSRNFGSARRLVRDYSGEERVGFYSRPTFG